MPQAAEVPPKKAVRRVVTQPVLPGFLSQVWSSLAKSWPGLTLSEAVCLSSVSSARVVVWLSCSLSISFHRFTKKGVRTLRFSRTLVMVILAKVAGCGLQPDVPAQVGILSLQTSRAVAIDKLWVKLWVKLCHWSLQGIPLVQAETSRFKTLRM